RSPFADHGSGKEKGVLVRSGGSVYLYRKLCKGRRNVEVVCGRRKKKSTQVEPGAYDAQERGIRQHPEGGQFKIQATRTERHSECFPAAIFSCAYRRPAGADFYPQAGKYRG